MLIPIGFFGGGVSKTFELISTTVVGSSVSTITFSSIPQTYKHLQLRTSVRSDGYTGFGLITFNGDTTNSYSSHFVEAGGSSTYAGNRISQPNIAISNWIWRTTNGFNSSVMEITDYSSSSVNKTVRSINGRNSFNDGNPTISLTSGLWRNTQAISSITFAIESSGTFAANSRISLYGIKG